MPRHSCIFRVCIIIRHYVDKRHRPETDCRLRRRRAPYCLRDIPIVWQIASRGGSHSQRVLASRVSSMVCSSCLSGPRSGPVLLPRAREIFLARWILLAGEQLLHTLFLIRIFESKKNYSNMNVLVCLNLDTCNHNYNLYALQCTSRW